MTRLVKILPIAALALMMLAPGASAQRRGFGGFRGGFRGGFGFGGFYGPAYYGWYGPYWGPGWGPYGYYGEGYGYGGGGQVKIESHAKDALVYVDKGYIGTVEKSKHFNLKTGEHDIELRDPSGHTFYSEHISVLPGHTTEIRPDTAPAEKKK
ncbi:MAG TPA: hypothetical protein VFO34_11660 [Candidatus Acidoferrales bacterium]|nr:hypothetical protein [Candidatus Acidoferrales bacterium]